MAEWSLELSGFDLHFANTKTIKSMAMADFLAKWTPTPDAGEEPQSSLPGNEDHGRWTMYFDGSFSYEGAGAGVFRAYCAEVGTRVCYASVAHPRSNGQVERANAEVLRGLKTKTFDRFKAGGTGWIDQVPSVLWSLRTTPCRATGETLFSLVYGAEAVLPTELKYGSP